MIIENGPYYVYIHVNKINEKMYVGISKRQNPNQRWRNGKGYTYNWHFNEAIKKYGWDNFEHFIFAENLTEDEASNAEQMLIEKLNTTNRDYGYNFAPGGLNNRSLKGELNPLYEKRPEKAIKASIESRTGKHLSDEHKQKIKNSNIGKHKNENSINALMKHCGDPKPSIRGSGNHKSTAVKCLETNMIFESQLIAEREMNLPRSSVYQAIKNNIRAKGYHFIRV